MDNNSLTIEMAIKKVNMDKKRLQVLNDFKKFLWENKYRPVTCVFDSRWRRAFSSVGIWAALVTLVFIVLMRYFNIDDVIALDSAFLCFCIFSLFAIMPISGKIKHTTTYYTLLEQFIQQYDDDELFTEEMLDEMSKKALKWRDSNTPLKVLVYLMFFRYKKGINL